VVAAARRLAWRRAGLATSGALVLAGAVLVAEVWLAINREYLPTEPPLVIDQLVAPARAAGGLAPLELVVLGDSTTAGVGSPSAAQSLPVLVARQVADRSGRAVHVVGHGVSGARTDTVRSEQVPRVLDEGVDVVLVVVGSNDVTHLTPWWQMQTRTAALLDAARERSGAPVVLGGIPQFRTVPALLQPLRTLTGAYAVPLRRAQRAAVAAAGEGVSFVDIAALASPRFLGVPESMSSDGFHPSEIGYGFWADALAPAVAEAAG